MTQSQKNLIFYGLFLLLAEPVLGQKVHQSEFERDIRDKLNQIFTAEQYILDVQGQAGDARSGTAIPHSNELLPGFEMLGKVRNSTNAKRSFKGQSPADAVPVGDILLIVDKSLSKQRTAIAEQIIRRLLVGEGLENTIRLSVRQEDIAHVIAPPPDSKKEAPPPGVLDEVRNNYKFFLKGLLVLWGAVVSLMAAYVLLSRIFKVSAQTLSSSALGRSDNSSLDSRSKHSSHDSDAPKRQIAASKHELYSKDGAILKQIEEIVNDAQGDPRKAAKIMTRWVNQSDESVRYAGILLKNCDIKTTEKICSLLHPSDLEKILEQKIPDFDPFSDENQRVLEKTRADLALLAAEQIFKERPDPLDFMRTLSDEDIANVLRAETVHTIALVSTQLPVHRLQKFYASLDHEKLSLILMELANIPSPNVEEFSAIKDRLSGKVVKVSTNLFNDKTRLLTLGQIIQFESSPKAQIEMACLLRAQNKALFALIRQHLILASDFNHIPHRVMTVLIQTIDADVFAKGLSGLGMSFEKLQSHLPTTYSTVFSHTIDLVHDELVRTNCWKKIVLAFREMANSGMITTSEISAIMAAGELDFLEKDPQVAPDFPEVNRGAA